MVGLGVLTTRLGSFCKWFYVISICFGLQRDTKCPNYVAQSTLIKCLYKDNIGFDDILTFLTLSTSLC